VNCPYFKIKIIGDEMFDYCTLIDMYITESDCKTCPENKENPDDQYAKKTSLP
jgi:hypothetical protein